MSYRNKTRYPGVYERTAQNRSFKGKLDICYDITYKLEGKKIWEKVGWVSEGYSAKLASDIRSERLRSIRHGEELPQQKEKAPLLRDIATKYLSWSKDNKNRQGIEDKSRYTNHLESRFGEKRLDEITSFDLEKMKSEMAKEGLSPKTISHCLGLIRTMLNKASDWGVYSGPNPVRKVKIPTVQNKRERFLDHKEAKLLLEELQRRSPQLYDISLISLYTGARAGEIFALKGQHINLDAGIITFIDTKNGETRHAYMTKDLRKLFKSRMPVNREDYIFKDKKHGGKIKEVSQTFQRIVDKLNFNNGIKDPRQKIVFHSLRHSFASWLALQGETIQTISELLGHKTLQMTMRYSHLTPDHRKAAINRLEQSIIEGEKARAES